MTPARQGTEATGSRGSIAHASRPQLSADHELQKFTAAKSALPPHRMMPTR